MKFYLVLHAGKLKSKRQSFNQQQTSVLEAFFKDQPFPKKANLKGLAIQTGLSEKQVTRWFEHARRKARGKNCEQNLYLSEFVSWKMVHNDYICIYVNMC